MRLTDLGNAELLIRQFGADYKWFPARGVWLQWDGARWVDDDLGTINLRAGDITKMLGARAAELTRAAGEHEDGTTEGDIAASAAKSLRQWARESQFRSRLDAMIDVARDLAPLRAAQLDADPWLLNTPTGVLDLQTLQLKPPTRELLQTKITAAVYEPDAHSELWCRFLEQVTGGDVELQHYLQRCMGYALYGAFAEKHFWFAYGAPDGGKSTFLNIIGAVMGSYHVAADANTWMRQQTGGNRGDLTRLMGARLVTSSEVQPDAVFDPKLLKQVTGGDAIVAAAKYEREVSFIPAFGLWLAGNNRPRIGDNDDGMWRRTQCVPFTHSVPRAQQDKRLAAKLTSPDHAPAVLRWLVDGCRMWQDADGIGSATAVDAATAEYRRTMNPLEQFAEECLVITESDADVLLASDAQGCYREWCRKGQVTKPVSPQTFVRAMTELGAVYNRSNDARRWSKVRLTAEAKKLVWL